MEEIEVPLEQAQEEIHHHAEHEHGGWVMKVALSSAVLAVFAALSALLAGHHSNEAVLEQIHASDHWSYFQAKGIKSDVLASRIELLKALGKGAPEKDQEKLEEYKKEKEEISAEAKSAETAAKMHLALHQELARAVTLFQVAIAVGAVSVLTRRRRFWFVSLVFGAVGIVFFLLGLL